MQIMNLFKKVILSVFPSMKIYKSLPVSAGDTGSVPRSRKVPHAVEQLSPRPTVSTARGGLLAAKRAQRAQKSINTL